MGQKGPFTHILTTVKIRVDTVAAVAAQAAAKAAAAAQAAAAK